MKTAPPTLPGMPQANSRPVSPCSSAARETSAMAAPGWQVMRVPETSMSSRPAGQATITPRKPPSPTSRSEPKPRTK